MKYTFIFSLIIFYNSVMGQDVLLKTSNPSGEQFAPVKPIKPDSLTSQNQGFIQSIQKTYNVPDKQLLSTKELNAIEKPEISDNEKDNRDKIRKQYEDERSRLKVKSDSVTKAISEIVAQNRQLADRRAAMAATEKNNSDLKNANVLLKERADLMASISREQSDYYDKINANKSALVKIISELKQTRDSLNELNKQASLSRNQIKNSTFRIASLYSLYDTTFTRANKLTIIDSISNFSTIFAIQDENVKDLTDAIKTSVKNVEAVLLSSSGNDTLLDSLSKVVRTLVVNKDTLTNETLKKTEEISKNIAKALSRLTVDQNNNSLTKLRSEFKNFSNIFISIKTNYNAVNKRYATFFNNSFSEKKKPVEETEFGAFPNLSSLIGEQRTLNLNISILGSYTKRDDKQFSSFEARLFTGNVPKGLTNARSLFIPEASTFGTQIKYTTGVKLTASKPLEPEKQVATNLGGQFELNLLSKRLATGIGSTTMTSPSSGTSSVDDLNNFVIHARVGGELVVLKDVFSIYTSANWITLLDNVQKFHEQYKSLNQITDKSSWFFFDVGCRLLFNPSGGDAKKFIGSGLKIVADFNLIVPKLWGRQLINNTNDITQTDKVLPVIRIGIRKSLGIIHEQ